MLPAVGSADLPKQFSCQFGNISHDQGRLQPFRPAVYPGGTLTLCTGLRAMLSDALFFNIETYNNLGLQEN